MYDFADGRPLPCSFFWWYATPIRFFSNGATADKNKSPDGEATPVSRRVVFNVKIKSRLNDY